MFNLPSKSNSNNNFTDPFLSFLLIFLILLLIKEIYNKFKYRIDNSIYEIKNKSKKIIFKFFKNTNERKRNSDLIEGTFDEELKKNNRSGEMLKYYLLEDIKY